MVQLPVTISQHVFVPIFWEIGGYLVDDVWFYILFLPGLKHEGYLQIVHVYNLYYKPDASR